MSFAVGEPSDSELFGALASWIRRSATSASREVSRLWSWSMSLGAPSPDTMPGRLARSLGEPPFELAHSTGEAAGALVGGVEGGLQGGVGDDRWVVGGLGVEGMELAEQVAVTVEGGLIDSGPAGDADGDFLPAGGDLGQGLVTRGGGGRWRPAGLRS